MLVAVTVVFPDRDVQNFHTIVMAWMVEMESAMTKGNLMEDLNNRCTLFIQVGH